MKIALIGLACAGKSTVAAAIVAEVKKSNRKVAVVKFAQPIYDALHCVSPDKNRGFMVDFASMAKRHYGSTVFVDAMAKQLNSLPENTALVCDDVRFKNEFAMLSAAGWTMVYVYSSATLRKQRSKDAGLEWLPNDESEVAVESLATACDWVLHGDASPEELSIFAQCLVGL